MIYQFGNRQIQKWQSEKQIITQKDSQTPKITLNGKTNFKITVNVKILQILRKVTYEIIELQVTPVTSCLSEHRKNMFIEKLLKTVLNTF